MTPQDRGRRARRGRDEHARPAVAHPSGEPVTSAAPTLDEALQLRLQGLATALEDRPDDRFRAETRARLVAMAAVRSPAPARPSVLRRLLAARPDAARSRWRSRATAGLAGAALAVTALGTVVALSQGAAPGDALYDVKRGSEQTELALAADDRRGLTLLGFATTRLAELTELTGGGGTAMPVVGVAPGEGTTVLAAAGDDDDELVVETLSTMDAQTTEGAFWVTSDVVRAADPAALAVLEGWTTAQLDGLADITPRLPAGAEDAATGSRSLLDGVAERTAALQQAFSCPEGLTVEGEDELGPVPAPCGTAPATSSPGAPGGTPPGPAPGTVPSSGAAPTPSAPAGEQPTTGSAPGAGSPSDSPQAAGTPAPALIGGGRSAPPPAAPPTTVGQVPPGPLPAPVPVPVPSLPPLVPALPSLPPSLPPLVPDAAVEVPLPVPPLCVGGLLCVGR